MVGQNSMWFEKQTNVLQSPNCTAMENLTISVDGIEVTELTPVPPFTLEGNRILVKPFDNSYAGNYSLSYDYIISS